MQYLYEKVAYLRGLSEGLDISVESKEGKLLAEIINVLGEFADAIVDVSEDLADVENFVEAIDEDLSDIEDDFYDVEEEDDEDFDFVEMECPHCEEMIEIDEDLLYDESEDIYCPHCGEIVIHSIEDDEEGCCSTDGCTCNR
ncbi:MAG: CD1247 N-terminal domain-containing protein [Filifactoraceae bacterium]